MASKGCYSVTTRQFVLRCKHREWLEATQKLYNEVLLFYYNLFLDCAEGDASIMGQSAQQILRSLEVLTIVGRAKEPVPAPLAWKGVPLYFRRAAINAAAAAGRRDFARNRETGQKESKVKRTEQFTNSVTFYKGMYRELSEDGIDLKIWTGKDWRFIHCRLGGNRLPQEADYLSPSLVLKDNRQFLNIPVRETVQDGRNVKERIERRIRVCSVQFTNRDAFAVAVISDGDSPVSVRFFRGGDAYAHQCRQLLVRIREAEKKMGMENRTLQEFSVGCQDDLKPGTPHNKKYWIRLKHVSEHYAHSVSRQIVDYCVEQGAELLILPRYEKAYTRCVMYSTGNWSPLHLSGQIRKQLAYKSWQQGILLLETQPVGCSKVCALCKAPLRIKGAEYICENGHQGNRYVNTAQNLSRKCLESLNKNLRNM